MTSKEIRKAFLDFFASKGHQIVPSAPMVVKNDPTLMFTNAGMNQFKDWFLGNSPAKWKRVADSQKCLRVSGKHNDLEEVGRDTYHHTMFEMLGNWSFGDYFKVEAIDWAWELLTEVYKLDKERLYATVFEGSEADGTTLDTEAMEAWKKHLPEDRILLGNKKDNFWEMGDTGPCGPCSEIHIDLRSDEERAAVPGASLVNKDHHLVIEIWNNVFMQYNRKASGELELLPNKNVDTGMGFERLCMALQGKQSNYDTDVFTGMIAKIEELSGHKYGNTTEEDIAMRVIADHIRAISFSIADGQLPSNVKAGYVIRRILRRAVRYGYTFLGFNEPFICRLVQQLVDDMGEFYPEIVKQQTLIERVIKEEEMAFLRTLDRGIRLMDNIMAKSAETKLISGEDAFVLYDTFGFPIDLSELIASEKGYTIDIEGFHTNITDSRIEGSTAHFGGGINCEGDNATISNTVLNNNNATGATGSEESHGGSLVVYGTNTHITNTTVANSTSINGGGVYIEGNNTVITDSTIYNNNATVNGGGVYIYGDNTTITKSTFELNNAIPDKDAIDDGLGGAIFISTDREATNNTYIGDSNFTHNTARNGSAIYVTPTVEANNCTIIGGCNFTENQAWSYWLPIFIDEVAGTIETNLTGGNNIINAYSWYHIYDIINISQKK